MAKLELIPNLSHVLAQGGVFLAASVVVRHYFLNPYYALKSRRHQETAGLSQRASDLTLRCSNLEEEVNTNIAQAVREVHEQSRKLKVKTSEELGKVAFKAKAEAERVITQCKAQVAEQLSQEKKSLGVHAKKLADMLFVDLTS